MNGLVLADLEAPHHGFARDRLENAAFAGVIAFFAAALTFLPPSLFESIDYVYFYRPNLRFLVEAVAEGRAPLWNPYIGLGRPFLADLQNGVFYPPIYLICLGEAPGIYLLVFSHCLLGGFGMRALGRALGMNKKQTYFSAACFLMCGALTARWMTGQIFYVFAICYLPLLFRSALQMDHPFRLAPAGFHASLMALQLLCGHPQVFWYSTLGQAVFILVRSLQRPWVQAFKAAASAIFRFGVSCIWCGGLSAAALLPFVELISEGNRSDPSPAFANFGRMEWIEFKSLFTSVSPGFPVNWEMNLFVGIFIFAFGVAGLCRLQDRNIRALLGVLLVGFLICIGDRSPLFDFFYHWLPGFSSFRMHARAGLLIVFVLICSAGLWLSRPHPLLRSIVEENLALPPRYFLMVILALQCLLLLHANWRIKTTYSHVHALGRPPEYPFQWTLVERLRKAGFMEPLQPPPRVSVPQTRINSNAAMVHHYGTFDALTSLFLKRPWEYLHRMAGQEPSEILNSFVSEKIYLQSPFPYRDLGLVAGIEPKTGTLLLSTNISPRAFLSHRVDVAPNRDFALSALAKGHDIHQTTLLEEPSPISLLQTNPVSREAVHIRRFEPNSILLEVEAAENALLVLAEAWYPGWKAEVDGKPVQVIPANVWMRAVAIPAGAHTVRLFFRQNYLLSGALVSSASLALLLVVWFRSTTEKRRVLNEPPTEK